MYLKFVILFVSVTQIFSELCQSPQNEPGSCQRVVDCSVIIGALSLKTMSSDSIYYCDTNKSVVCCQRPNATTSKPVASALAGVKGRRLSLPSKATADITEICGMQHSDDYPNDNEEKDVTLITEFPWIARLRYNRKGDDYEESLCTGSLISRKHVLTAAQCIFDDAELTNARLGEYHFVNETDCVHYADINAGECTIFKDYPVKRTIRHEGYSGQNDGVHNLALVILKSEVLFTDYIRPICLLQPDTPRQSSGQGLAASSWGWRIPDATTFWVVKNKQKIKLRKLTKDDCTNMQVSLQQNQLCATQVKTGLCIYENGGPVMFPYYYRWYQEGIALGGMKNCLATTVPLVYVNVAEYSEWIVANMKDS